MTLPLELPTGSPGKCLIHLLAFHLTQQSHSLVLRGQSSFFVPGILSEEGLEEPFEPLDVAIDLDVQTSLDNNVGTSTTSAPAENML